MKKVLTGLLSLLAIAGNTPLLGLKDMVTDTLTHKAKEKKAEAENKYLRTRRQP